MPIIAVRKPTPLEMFEKYKKEAASRLKDFIKFETEELARVRHDTLSEARRLSRTDLRSTQSFIRREFDQLLQALPVENMAGYIAEAQNSLMLDTGDASESEVDLPTTPRPLFSDSCVSQDHTIEVTPTGGQDRGSEVSNFSKGTVPDSDPPMAAFVTSDNNQGTMTSFLVEHLHGNNVVEVVRVANAVDLYDELVAVNVATSSLPVSAVEMEGAVDRHPRHVHNFADYHHSVRPNKILQMPLAKRTYVTSSPGGAGGEKKARHQL